MLEKVEDKFEEIEEKFDEKRAETRSWLHKKAEGPHARFWLSVLAFSDAAFFIIPPDVLLIPIVALFPKRWFWYGNIAVFGSLLGGVLGYFIGHFAYDLLAQPIVDFYQLADYVAAIEVQFHENAFWAIFIAAFTPVPYKIFTISAGALSVNFFTFIVASFVGRGLRYWILGYVVSLFGEKLGAKIQKYINTISLVLVVVIIVLIAVYFLL